MGYVDSSSSGAAVLLAQRFRTMVELRAHLYAAEGLLLVFFRLPPPSHTRASSDTSLHELRVGARVALQITCDENGQSTTLRGTLFARPGNTPGFWLGFPDTGLRKKIERGQLRDRTQRRVGCDLLVQAISAGKPQLGRLVDLSMGGARITGISGFQSGDGLQLRILSPPSSLSPILVNARVAFAGDKGLGVRLDRSDPTARQAITRLFDALQQAWSQAPEAVHSFLCCRDGVLLDPMMPRLRERERVL
jgi:hypothetical protein